ncbi:MAG: enoyl-CoA hydratase/isomerase family protein [Candidatus Helarchaeota archaeon]|nr:enoyl-CoA hydratase/isomerase family protein [Candidatus Helarchaeota archaeon]
MSKMTYETILVSTADRIGIVTINRPNKLNALNRQVKAELAQALTQLDSDPQVDIIILTGAGDKSFIAGDDIAEFPTRTQADFLPFQELTLQIEALKKPVIAAINGYALGGGCELALACDFRIASTSSKFGLPEINLGIIPGAGGTQRLPKLIGKSRALEIIMTGEPIDATAAKQIGLVDKLVPPQDLLEETRKFAKKLLEKSQLAIQSAKKAVNYSTDNSIKNGLKKELDLLWQLKNTEESKKRVEKFLKKK